MSFPLLLILAIGLNSAEPLDQNYGWPEDYQQALRLCGQKEYASAIAGLKALVDRRPEFLPAYRKLVEAFRVQKDLEQAEIYFNTLNSRSPGGAGAQYGLGLVYYERSDFERAAERFKRSLERLPAFAEVFDRFNESQRPPRNSLDDAIRFLMELIKAHPRYAYAHYGLGQALRMKRDWEQSQYHIDLALQIEPNLLEAYRAKGVVYEETRRFKDALSAYEKALSLAQARNDLENESKLILSIGVIHSHQGNYDKAIYHYERALPLSRAIGQRRDEGIILTNMGGALARLARLSEAEAYLRQAIKIRREIGDRLGEGNCLQNMAVVQKNRGDSRKALETYEQAQRIFVEIGSSEKQAEILTNAGILYAELGDYSKALTNYQRALDTFLTLKDLYRQASTLNKIGSVYRRLGQLSKALQFQQRALKLQRQVDNRREIGNTYSDIGVIYRMKEQHARALDYFGRALKIHEALKNPMGQTATLNNIGHLHIKMGQPARAREYFDRSLAMARKIGNPLSEAIALYGTGTTYAKQSDPAKAFEFFAKAHDIGQAIHQPELVWSAGLGLAKALEKRGETEASLERYKQSVAVIEKLREGLATDELRWGFFRDRVAAYEGLVNLLLALHARHPTQGYDRQAFEYVERSRARAMLDALAEANVDVRAGIPVAQKERERELLRAVSRAQSAVRAETGEAKKQERLVELAQHEQALDAFLVELRLSNPRYADLRYPAPYTLREVQQKVVQDGECLLEFFIGEEKSFLFQISRERFEVLPLPKRQVIASSVLSYRRLIADSPIGPEISKTCSATYQQGFQLYRLLLGKAQLPARAKLIIIADGPLHYIPFQALITKPTPENEDPVYLVSRHEITYAPSASVLGWIEKPPGPQKAFAGPPRLLAFGDPLLSTVHRSALATAPGGRALDAIIDYKFPHLPFAQTEVRNIAKLYPPDQARVYLGEYALESAFKKENLRRYQHIHLAAHGLIDEEFPSRSGILLRADAEEDGLLQMREIFNLELDAEVVVLSACKTGIGKMVSGEGLVGLTRAFLYAGSRSVLVSLWEVRDQTTAQLMKQFYNDLLKGISPPQALRRAHQLTLNSPRLAWRHPYFWAPFILVGRS